MVSMNNKKLLAFFVALIIIIILVLLGLQRCEPRIKDEEDNPLPEVTENTDKTTEDYYNAFINANIDFTCQIKHDTSILDNQDTFKEKLNQAYLDNGLPVENDPLMVEILDKYQNDATVQKTVIDNTQECL